MAQSAPDLDAQVTALQKAFGTQTAQLQELTRLVRDLNGVGGKLQQRQQTELLRSVLTRLGDLQTTAPARLVDHAQGLSTEFESVSVHINAALENPRTAGRTTAALSGATGDAISRLDFQTATNQLEEIAAKLNEIGTKVDALGRTSQKTAETLEAIREDQLRTERAEEEQRADMEKSAKERERQALDEPRNFVQVKLMAYSSKIMNPAWSLHAFVDAAKTPLSDPHLEVAFQGMPQPVKLDMTARLESLQSPEAGLSRLSTRATICFSAFDPRVSTRRQVRVDLAAQVHEVGLVTQVDFVQLSTMTLGPEEGTPCHLSTALASGAPSIIATPAGAGGSMAVSAPSMTAMPVVSPGEQAAALYRAHRYSEALPLLQKTAIAGDGHSAMILGGMYAMGEGVPADARQAMQWWQRGADLGDAHSMASLGATYTSKAQGMVPDYIKAAFWFRKAAERAEPDGLSGLGICYLNGQGVPGDPAQSARLFQQAADQGKDFAMVMLGRLYSAGNGVPRDPRQAEFWYRKAAALGNPQAVAALGGQAAAR